MHRKRGKKKRSKRTDSFQTLIKFILLILAEILLLQSPNTEWLSIGLAGIMIGWLSYKVAGRFAGDSSTDAPPPENDGKRKKKGR